MRLLDLWPDSGSTDWDTLDKAYPWAKAMHGVEQSRVHHAEGDVSVHARMVTDALVGLSGYQQLSVEDRKTLWLAAVLHDVGKSVTTTFENGDWRAVGHSRVGSLWARQILWLEGMTHERREQVCGLILSHQIPFWLLNDTDGEWLRKLYRTSEVTRWDFLSILAEADARGRISEDQDRILDSVMMAREMAREHGIEARGREWANGRTRYEYFLKKERALDYAAHDASWGDVYVMSGLPGSGKSTEARRIAASEGIEIISLDEVRRELKVKWGENQSRVIFEAKERAKACLRAKKGFVWDATTITKRRREEIVSLIVRYGARANVVAIDSTRDWVEAMERQRPEGERVGMKAIDDLARGWEWPQSFECDQVSKVDVPVAGREGHRTR